MMQDKEIMRLSNFFQSSYVPFNQISLHCLKSNSKKRELAVRRVLSTDKYKAAYRKDSIKRPGGYLTFINIWGGAKSRGALNQGGRLFHRKGI